jgi:hypothetical protein
MEVIKEALMKWSEAMQVVMENRALSYSHVLDHWRVKKWAGKREKGFLYDGPSFEEAFKVFLGSHAVKDATQGEGNNH